MRLLNCLDPVTGWRLKGVNPSTGKKYGLLNVETARKYSPFQLEEVSFRCGKCLNCLKYRGSCLIARCVAESRCHEDNAFITLTVSDESLDSVFPGSSLCHRPFQLFFKRLRKRLGVDGIKYMMCGEYGELFSRPHYHAIVFGVAPFCYSDTGVKRPDGLAYLKTRLDNPVFKDSWPYGEVYCGTVTPASIAYVSGYTLKQFVLGRDEEWYSSRGLAPEYVRWSRRPGLGLKYFQEFNMIDESDSAAYDCGVPIGNRRVFAGRYYLDWLRLTASAEYDKLLSSYERGNHSDSESEALQYDKALAERSRRVDYLFHSVDSSRRV